MFLVDSIADALERVGEPRDGSGARTDAAGHGIWYVLDDFGVWTGLRESLDDVRYPHAIGTDSCDYSATDVGPASAWVRNLLDLDSAVVIDDAFNAEYLYDASGIQACVLGFGSYQGSDIRPHWLNYFAVEDVDLTTARAVEAGARVRVAPSFSPVNRYAVLEDPFGHNFGLARSLDPADRMPLDLMLADEGRRLVSYNAFEAGFNVRT